MPTTLELLWNNFYLDNLTVKHFIVKTNGFTANAFETCRTITIYMYYALIVSYLLFYYALSIFCSSIATMVCCIMFYATHYAYINRDNSVIN